MKYAYVVTRIFSKFEKGIIEIPNLGVHSSMKKAKQHYLSVLKSRGLNFSHVEEITSQHDVGRMRLIASAYFIGPSEEVRLEKWRLK